MTWKEDLARFHSLLDDAETNLRKFASSAKPFVAIDNSNVRRMFFAKPTAFHYMIIAMGRSISSARASFLLYSSGYYLESMTEARFLVENQSRLEYVLAGISLKGTDNLTSKFVEKYFADNSRRSGEWTQHNNPRQKEIHDRVVAAAKSDRSFLKEIGLETDEFSAEEHSVALSRLYNFTSNFAHGRYPEAMTLFGFDSQILELEGVTGWQDKDVDAALYAELGVSIERQMKMCILKANMAKFNVPASCLSWAFGGLA